MVHFLLTLNACVQENDIQNASETLVIGRLSKLQRNNLSMKESNFFLPCYIFELGAWPIDENQRTRWCKQCENVIHSLWDCDDKNKYSQFYTLFVQDIDK